MSEDRTDALTVAQFLAALRRPGKVYQWIDAWSPSSGRVGGYAKITKANLIKFLRQHPFQDDATFRVTNTGDALWLERQRDDWETS